MPEFLRGPSPLCYVAFLVLLILSAGSAAGWTEKVLYNLQGGTDGSTPVGRLVFDNAGNIFGVTSNGGSSSCISIFECGTVFKLSRPLIAGDPWIETVLYVFKGNAAGDGTSPFGGLVMDQDGNLFGTTAYGGAGNCLLLGSKEGCGTVYELSRPTERSKPWTERVLYSFRGWSDGELPIGDLVFDEAGNLYGATTYGGGFGSCNAPYYHHCGTVFKLSRPKKKDGEWVEKVLYGFTGGSDGAAPNGRLLLYGKGEIYGTTVSGGNTTGICNYAYAGDVGCGAVFKLTPPTQIDEAWVETVLYRFYTDSQGAENDGANPNGGLMLDNKGNLYGTTLGGGDIGWGTIFALTPRSNNSWSESVLYRFQDNNDGSQPRTGLVFDARGVLYGTATGGGAAGGGAIFELGPSGASWTFSPLYEFLGNPDGSYPVELRFAPAGGLYGTTQYGGNSEACANYGCGTVFELKR